MREDMTAVSVNAAAVHPDIARLRALELAVESRSQIDDPKSVVDRAATYYNFLSA